MELQRKLLNFTVPHSPQYYRILVQVNYCVKTINDFFLKVRYRTKCCLIRLNCCGELFKDNLWYDNFLFKKIVGTDSWSYILHRIRQNNSERNPKQVLSYFSTSITMPTCYGGSLVGMWPTAAGEDEGLGGVNSNGPHIVTVGIKVVNPLQGVVIKHADLK